MKKQKIISFPGVGHYKVKRIFAAEEKKKFYCVQGIYEGREAEVIFREGERAIIRVGQTKIALAGDALSEISLSV